MKNNVTKKNDRRYMPGAHACAASVCPVQLVGEKEEAPGESHPAPGLPPAFPGMRVGFFRYPFATRDTKRNSSDACARDPRQTSTI